MRVRVATFNVRSFRRGFDLAVEAFDDLPDILLLQESGPKRTTAAFAETLGMQFVSSHRAFRQVHNAVLFRPPWRVVRSEARDLTPQGRTLPRGFVMALLRFQTAHLTAVSAHLGLSPREREVHARELTDALLASPGPIIVGADLNEGPEDSAARWIAGRLFDAYARNGHGPGATFPSAAPSARIDYLFAGEGVRAVKCWVGGERSSLASDHLPVMAELELAEPT